MPVLLVESFEEVFDVFWTRVLSILNDFLSGKQKEDVTFSFVANKKMILCTNKSLFVSSYSSSDRGTF